MVAKKFASYTAIGDEITPGNAVVQAAHALDLAASFAIESRDSEQLSQIALVWIELATRLSGGEDEEDEDEEGDVAGESEDYPLGFASPAVDARIRERNKEKKNGTDED